MRASKELWGNPDKAKGSLNGIGAGGRPVIAERYLLREPFLTVESEEVYTYGLENRLERPRERYDCAAARQRREVQVRK